MRIVVLGAGVLGVTTAHALSADGHDVTVIDRGKGPASESSFANGGQLSYTHAEPWATPSVLPKLAKWMLKKDAPLVFHFRPEAAMWGWGMRFLRECTPARAERNTQAALRLGLYSRTRMHTLIAETQVEFDHERTGILHIFRLPKMLDAARRQADYQARFGGIEEELTAAQCIEREPALATTREPIVGGMLAPLDEEGDVYSFTVNLTDWLTERKRAQFVFGRTVRRIRTERDRVVAVETDGETIDAEAVVVCLGAESPHILKPLGIHVPIYPLKGYSLTYPAPEGTPRMSLTDGERKIVFSRLGDRLRVAGTAELAGYNTTLTEHRIAPIRRGTEALFPVLEGVEPTLAWACLRPSIPDGAPVIGRTKYTNLFLNTGHGTLGWTMAAGSAALLADLMEGREPEISPEGLTLARFGQ